VGKKGNRDKILICSTFIVFLLFILLSLDPIVTPNEEIKVSTQRIPPNSLVDSPLTLGRNDENALSKNYDPLFMPLENLDGNWLYVGGDGPGNYSSIQDAIDAANEGDYIFIFNGTYWSQNIIVNKNHLLIMGENKEDVIIHSSLEIQANDVCLRDVKVSYGGFHAAGIVIDGNSSGNMIYDCNISGRSAGITIVGDPLKGLYPANNTIVQNTINNSEYNMYMYYTYNNTFVDNEIISAEFYQIHIDNCEGNKFYKNRISGTRDQNNSCIELDSFSYKNMFACNTISNSAGYGIDIYWQSNDNFFVNNKINRNYIGVKINRSYSNILYNNYFEDNIKYNAYDNSKNIWNYPYSYPYQYGWGNYWDDYNGSYQPGEMFGDDPYIIPGGNNSDAHPLIWGTIFNVDKGTYYRTINEAVSDAENNNDIIVYSGIYCERIQINKSLTLEGSGSPKPTIECTDIYGIEIDAPNVCVSNLRFNNGSVGINIYYPASNTNITNCEFNDQYHYGIWIMSGCNHNYIYGNTIRNTNIYGMFIYQDSTDLSGNNTISDNIITNCGYGIVLQLTHDNNITKNIVISSGGYGIFLCNSWKNRIFGNELVLNKYSIVIEDVSYRNTVSSNYISLCWNGIDIKKSSYTLLENNDIYKSGTGLEVYDSEGTILRNNNICETSCKIITNCKVDARLNWWGGILEPLRKPFSAYSPWLQQVQIFPWLLMPANSGGQNDANSGGDASNNFLTATTIDFGNYSGYLKFYDEDWYRFYVDSGGTEIEIHTTPSLIENSYYLWVYTPRGEFQGGILNGVDGGYVYFYPKEKGYWRIQISPLYEEGIYSFQLELS